MVYYLSRVEADGRISRVAPLRMGECNKTEFITELMDISKLKEWQTLDPTI